MTEKIIYTNSINKYTNSMNKQDLSNLTKQQLIKLLLKQNDKIKMLFKKVNQMQKPIPAPRKNVKQMVQE